MKQKPDNQDNAGTPEQTQGANDGATPPPSQQVTTAKISALLTDSARITEWSGDELLNVRARVEEECATDREGYLPPSELQERQERAAELRTMLDGLIGVCRAHLCNMHKCATRLFRAGEAAGLNKPGWLAKIEAYPPPAPAEGARDLAAQLKSLAAFFSQFGDDSQDDTSTEPAGVTA